MGYASYLEDIQERYPHHVSEVDIDQLNQLDEKTKRFLDAPKVKKCIFYLLDFFTEPDNKVEWIEKLKQVKEALNNLNVSLEKEKRKTENKLNKTIDKLKEVMSEKDIEKQERYFPKKKRYSPRDYAEIEKFNIFCDTPTLDGQKRLKRLNKLESCVGYVSIVLEKDVFPELAKIVKNFGEIFPIIDECHNLVKSIQKNDLKLQILEDRLKILKTIKNQRRNS